MAPEEFHPTQPTECPYSLYAGCLKAEGLEVWRPRHRRGLANRYNLPVRDSVNELQTLYPPVQSPFISFVAQYHPLE